MKIIISMILALTMVLTLASCTRNTQKTEASAPALLSVSSAASDDKDRSYSASDALPGHDITVTFSDKDKSTADSVTVTDRRTGERVQKIDLPENESFTELPVYFVDVNFDGSADLIIPCQRTAGAAYFFAYVYNPSEDKFVYAPTFENLPNFSIDGGAARILSHQSSDKVTSYSMSRYDTSKQDFVCENSLYWEAADGDYINHFVEESIRGGRQEKVYEISVRSQDCYSLNTADPRVKPYFAAGSFWNLNGKKWTPALRYADSAITAASD